MKSKHFRRLAALVAAAVVAVAMLAPAAEAREPAPGYGQFVGCPSPEENSAITTCIHSVVTGGHFDMGNKEVPITSPITINGGTEAGLKGFTFNSQGGMSKTKQKVPGGVIGLTGLTWLLEFLGSEALTLYAVTELTGAVELHGIQGISLPIKVHLINGTLGNNCYVGSTSSPISLNLTTGTTSPPPPNEPITGVPATGTFDLKTGIATLHGTYVDNSFSAPGASGCVLTLFGFIPISINGLVNSASGLPAAAGTNETVQELEIQQAGKGKVYP